MDNIKNYLNDLKTLISFKSVKSAKEPAAPFGKECRYAIDFIKSLAEKFGFTTIDYDGYCLEVDFGEGEEIGIMGHLDVVPAGDGWESEPYILTEKDGVYYGRGILDDKSPMLSCLYCLKELKESGIKVNKKFRMFFGTNEESGWEDVEYLKTKTNLPKYGFSPDGNFPVSYAEKGMCIVNFYLPKLKNFSKVKGGTVVNAVCGYATAQGIIDESLLLKHGLTVSKDGKIESVGKSAHGSRPELGINAIKKLFAYFIDCGENLEKEYKYLFGDGFSFSKMINEQGDVTFSPDIISEDETGIKITCDLRFPAPITLDKVLKKLEASGLKYTYSLKHGTQFVEKDGFLVDTLINAYNAVTGESAKPIAQSGSTFARVFEKGVAFGPEFPDKPSTIHEPNERASIEEIEKTYDIYKKAIFDLAK